MDKSLFQVPQMDCAAEENLVRMQLDGMAEVHSLSFDLSARNVAIYHEGGLNEIERALAQLGLGSRLIETGETSEALPENTQQRRLLWTVLLINFSFFGLEITTGFLSGSMGLVAASESFL